MASQVEDLNLAIAHHLAMERFPDWDGLYE